MIPGQAQQFFEAAAAQSDGEFKIERSVRFNPTDSPSLSKTFSSSGNRTTWSWSAWVKKTAYDISSDQCLFGGYGANNDTDWFEFGFGGSSDHTPVDAFYWTTNSTTSSSDAIFIDNSAWYHCLVTYDGSNIRVYVNSTEVLTSSKSGNLGVNGNWHHSIGRGPKSGSARPFYGYLAEINFVDGQALTPTSFGETNSDGVWVAKEYSGSYGSNGFYLKLNDNSSAAALGTDSSGNGNTWTVNNIEVGGETKTLTRLRFKTDWNWMYISQIKINGTALTTGTLDNSGGVWTDPDKWKNGSTGSGNETYSQSARQDWFDVTLASNIYNFSDVEIFMYLDSSAGSTTNVFELELFFSDGTSHSKVYPTQADAPNQTPYQFNSRQWQDFGAAGLALAKNNDSVVDTPLGYEADSGNNGGNYCIFNARDKNSQSNLSNGNLDWDVPSGGNGTCRGTIGVSSGKWYFEFEFNSGGGTAFGILEVSEARDFAGGSNAPNGYTYYSEGSSFTKKYHNGSNENYGDSFLPGAIIGVALNLDDGTITFYNNGVSQGVAYSGITGTYAPVVSYGSSVGSSSVSFNAGQRPFAISSIPTDHKALCTFNLSDPTISDGSTAMDAVAYTGTGAAKTISLGYGPDLVWTKQRSGAEWHYLIDTIRGKTLALFSNRTQAEYTTNAQVLTAFNSDGYSLGSDSAVNGSSSTYVGWSWNGGDLVTNSTYNQSAVWSDNAVGGRDDEPIQNLFDGSTSTFAQNTSGVSNPNNLIVNFSPSLSYTSKVEVYPYNASSVAINGGSQVSTTNQQWNTIATGSGTLTQLDFQRNHTNGCAISAIRIDDKILVDTGLIPVGSLNSSAYSQDDVYSDDLTTTGSPSGSPSNAFDGSLSTQYGTATGGAYTNPITFTPSGGLAYTSSVKVYSPSGQMAARINGGDWISYTTNAVIAVGSGTITTIEVTERRSSAGFGLYAIEVDGKILVDSNITPPSVPTIATVVTRNTTTGFAIAKYFGNATNSTVAHALNAPVKFIIVKLREGASGWAVYHDSIGTSTNNYIELQTTGLAAQDDTAFQDTAPTSQVFSIGTKAAVNENDDSHIAYCWAEVEGYSKFGSYTGAADLFIYTGFKPQWLLIKSYAGDGFNWVIIDNARGADSGNVSNKLYPNSGGAEDSDSRGTETKVVFLSNGFTFLDEGAETNSSSRSYIYAAFAENPFKSTTGGFQNIT